MPDPLFARWTFATAGIYGLVALLPQYFLEDRIGRDDPPAITHPEYFYGFIGVAVAWQVAFLLIARDPIRHRPLMIAAILEKFSWAAAMTALFHEQRITSLVFVFGFLDLVLGVLFLTAYVVTPSERTGSHSRANSRTMAVEPPT